MAPGASINVAFTFTIRTHGTFWFGYNVDALTGISANLRPASRSATHVGRRTASTTKPSDSGQIR